MAVFFDPFPIIYSADLPAATRFYRDLLGFTQTYRYPADGPPEFVVLRLDGGTIGLAAATSGQVGAHGEPMSPRSAGRSFELCVYATDVDEAVTALRVAGVSILVEPADQPWGERMAYAADPDGTPVMIAARHE